MESGRKIIHIDMDAFFASVEQRDNPDLRGKPVVVGGSPNQRGVVAAASYEARQFGIHSAMPSRTAAQRCAHLVFVRPRFDVYREVSGQIQDIFQRYTDLVEPLSLDEAYLDVTANKLGLPSATLIAQEIKAQIKNETQLTASAGVSINKFLAKSASAMQKPNGLFVIRPEQALEFLENLPIEKFYGIGKVTAQKMENLGIFKGADLKGWSETDLMKSFGKVGSFYYRIVRGQDDREVEPNRMRKSIGAEESFAVDLNDRSQVMSALHEIAHSVQRRANNAQTGGRTLTLKVKYGNYQQITRSRTVATSLSKAEDLLSIATELLSDTEFEERKVRLLGLTLSNLDSENEHSPYVQLTLDLA
jgi:DNA polymerase IV